MSIRRNLFEVNQNAPFVIDIYDDYTTSFLPSSSIDNEIKKDASSVESLYIQAIHGEQKPSTN